MKKTTLYVGAHSDDIFLGAGIKISRNPKDISVLTVTDGVSSVDYPWHAGGMTFERQEDYFQQRFKEDRKAMQALGVDANNRYHFGIIPDQQAYRNIDGIVRLIETIARQDRIKKIVTHSFPEAHPDHEIVWFASHVVGNRLAIPVLEFVTYRFNGETYQRTFQFPEEMESIETLLLTAKEQALQSRVSGIYRTQKLILKKFLSDSEVIGKRKRFDTKNLPDTTYYYGNREGLPSPKEIRALIRDYRN